MLASEAARGSPVLLLPSFPSVCLASHVISLPQNVLYFTSPPKNLQHRNVTSIIKLIPSLVNQKYCQGRIRNKDRRKIRVNRWKMYIFGVKKNGCRVIQGCVPSLRTRRRIFLRMGIDETLPQLLKCKGEYGVRYYIIIWKMNIMDQNNILQSTAMAKMPSML